MADCPRCTAALCACAFLNPPRLLLLALLCCVLPAHAETGKAAIEAGRLTRIQHEISALKEELGAVRGRRKKELRALEATDREIGRISSGLRATERELQDTTRQLTELETRRSAQQTQLAQMRTALLREVRASYRGAGGQRIRMLLSQDDPAVLGRMLVYQGYLARERAVRMEGFRSALVGLQETERDLQAQQARLDKLQAEQRAGVGKLQVEQARQHELVADLQHKLDSGSERLTELEEDQERVTRLLESLRKVFEDVPYINGPNKPLRQLKGQLSWPVAGQISMSYGARQAGGKMRARGVHIATRSGTDVHAIARGRIAFADWLKGFGLLVIIDHGDGYMSLYGENSSLYKSVGDRVERGDVISSAGNSGGQSRTGLYLELRKNGQPVDPGAWFKGKPVAQKQAGSAG